MKKYQSFFMPGFSLGLWLSSSAQNVGNSTNTPAYKLDVNGRMRVRTGTRGNNSTSSGIWLEVDLPAQGLVLHRR